MSVAIVTGAGGLVGAATVRRLAREGLDVVGVDNDTRASLFGPAASTRREIDKLIADVGTYTHAELDIRDAAGVDALFARYGGAIDVIVHAAAQPSHDWAARDPQADFGINATATLTLLEATRRHCPAAPFIFCSTNKVYGDRPNGEAFVELPTRWELPEAHASFAGFDETMSIDRCMHSLFGVSKVAADLMVQEYGRYFGLQTGCFRCGCITGPGHAGAQLHGFLSYLVKCAVADTPYSIIGHGGKQVRDNIHADDLADVFWRFFRAPRSAAVYNMGGGRVGSASVLEAIGMAEKLTGRPMRTSYEPQARAGDHQWWISDTGAFARDYPGWRLDRTASEIVAELVEAARG